MFLLKCKISSGLIPINSGNRLQSMVLVAQHKYLKGRFRGCVILDEIHLTTEDVPNSCFNLSCCHW